MIPDLRLLRAILLLPGLLYLLIGCASSTPVADLPRHLEQDRVNDLQLGILALGDDVDREEAQRAATIAIEYPLELAQQYQITDSPLVHNTLVNLGVKPRGLCTHWTMDLLTRLQQEEFQSLDLHWGIANYDSLFLIEHSTVVISARGDLLQQGLVLDPWRYGGHLFWAKTLEDSTYQWYPHAEIIAQKREREALVLNRPTER